MIGRRAAFVAVVGALVIPGVVACTMHAAGEAQSGGTSSGTPPPPPPPPPASTPAPTASATASASAAPTATAPQTSTATVKGDSVHIPGNIVFDTDKATLKAGSGSEVVLDQLKIFLDGNAQVTKLRVEGHTDNTGTRDHNVALSGARALTIKTWLVGKGIAKERLIAVGFGPDKPIADNKTEDGRAQNRRTEFKIAEISGKKYLGQPVDGGGKVFE